MLEESRSDTPRDGPLKGKPALRSRLRDAVEYLDAIRKIVPVHLDAPVHVWNGTRDDASLVRFADHFGLKGAARRVLAALDSRDA